MPFTNYTGELVRQDETSRVAVLSNFYWHSIFVTLTLTLGHVTANPKPNPSHSRSPNPKQWAWSERWAWPNMQMSCQSTKWSPVIGWWPSIVMLLLLSTLTRVISSLFFTRLGLQNWSLRMAIIAWRFIDFFFPTVRFFDCPLFPQRIFTNFKAGSHEFSFLNLSVIHRVAVT